MSLPNYISLFRLFLTPFFFTTLVSYRPGEEHYRWIAFGIFVFASLTDALDGFIARVHGERTALGTFLDPLADKMILMSGFLGLLFVEGLPYQPPLWVTVTIVFRDIVILGGLIVVFLMTKRIRVRPNFLGKCTTAFQMVTLIVILLAWPISVILWNITVALTIASCITYLVRDLKALKVHI